MATKAGVIHTSEVLLTASAVSRGFSPPQVLLDLLELRIQAKYLILQTFLVVRKGIVDVDPTRPKPLILGGSGPVRWFYVVQLSEIRAVLVSSALNFFNLDDFYVADIFQIPPELAEYLALSSHFNNLPRCAPGSSFLRYLSESPTTG